MQNVDGLPVGAFMTQDAPRVVDGTESAARAQRLQAELAAGDEGGRGEGKGMACDHAERRVASEAHLMLMHTSASGKPLTA
jgi:hypothetical protein